MELANLPHMPMAQDKCPPGFIRSGKVRGKRVFFALVRESQGKSGKLAVVRGKIAFSFYRSGKSFIFHHQGNMYNTLITR